LGGARVRVFGTVGVRVWVFGTVGVRVTARIRVTARVRGRALRLGVGLGLKSTSKRNQPIISAGDLRFLARKWKKNKSGKHQHSTIIPNTVCTPKEEFNIIIKSILLGSGSNFE
jgi:hypothetical protein